MWNVSSNRVVDVSRLYSVREIPVIFFQEKWGKAEKIVSEYPTFHLQHHLQISFHSSLRPTIYPVSCQRIDPLDPHGGILRGTIELSVLSFCPSIHVAYLKLINKEFTREIEINLRRRSNVQFHPILSIFSSSSLTSFDPKR